MILVAGGETDPNILAVWDHISDKSLEGYSLLVGDTLNPAISWDIESDELRINNQLCHPTAIFIRHDVFSLLDGTSTPDTTYRAHTWFTVVIGWAIAHPEVRLLNRSRALWMTNKPRMLHEAKKSGLSIPKTLVSNDATYINSVTHGIDSIAKSVVDGSYCSYLPDALEKTDSLNGCMASPATIQPQLITPEVRVFIIAGQFHAFLIESKVLDYRTDSDAKITPMKLELLPESLLTGLTTLMGRLGADFGAADFKTCAKTGDLLFLELNSSPMFSVFDKKCNGAVIQSIVDYLASSE